MKNACKLILSLSSAVLCASLTGCGIGGVSTPVTLNVPANAVTGKVMGGQQPVYNVAIQLYEVGLTGYGSASKPLLTPNTVYTTAYGNFTLPAFTCDTPGSLVYLTAVGGQPIPGTTNANLSMMVGLGACSGVTSQYIDVNEMTTIASVWSLAPFMTGIANIGSSFTNSLGISNAFASINKVANTATGALGGPALPSNGILPTTELNTLADILQACINSGGGVATDTTDGQTNGTACGRLFYLTGGGSGSTITDTVTAAMKIAQNPGTNVTKLNQLRASSPTFTPALNVNSSPTDWTIAIAYSGGGLNNPQVVATDQQGNVWLANGGNNSVSEFGPTGAAISTSTGFTGGGLSTPAGIAIDQSGNAWVANSGGTSITKIGPAGASATNYSGNSVSSPSSIAIDAAGNVFVGNGSGSKISAFTSTGGVLTGSPFAGGGLGTGGYVAVSPK